MVGRTRNDHNYRIRNELFRIHSRYHSIQFCFPPLQIIAINSILYKKWSNLALFTSYFLRKLCWCIDFFQSKISSSKKLTCKGTLRQVFLCLRPTTPCPSPLHTVYVYTVYLFTQGRGRVKPERWEGQQFSKLGRKYRHDWLYLQSINSDERLPQSSFTVNFLDDDILLWCLYS